MPRCCLAACLECTEPEAVVLLHFLDTEVLRSKVLILDHCLTEHRLQLSFFRYGITPCPVIYVAIAVILHGH